MLFGHNYANAGYSAGPVADWLIC